MNGLIRISKPLLRFSIGMAFTLSATAAYFGSDDWSRTVRPLGLIFAFGFYGVGLLVWLWYLRCLSRRQLFVAMGALVGVGCLVMARSQLVSDRSMYLWTHPYAFWLNLIDPPLLMDNRNLKNWTGFILEPYLLLFKFAIGVLLIAGGIRIGWQLWPRVAP